MRILALAESVNDFPKSRETSVDFFCFLKYFSLSTSPRNLLTSSKVDERDLGCSGFSSVEIMLVKSEGDDHMGAGGEGVHLGKADGAVFDPLRNVDVGLLLAEDVLFSDIGHEDALTFVGADLEV